MYSGDRAHVQFKAGLTFANYFSQVVKPKFI